MAAPTTGDDHRACVPAPDHRRVPATWRCETHGGFFPPNTGLSTCQTIWVLRDVKAERARQFAQYGTNENLEDGTGPNERWLLPITGTNATRLAGALRAAYEEYEAEHGKPTWMHLILEEVAEAFTETDPARLEAELIQVAALCVSWVEKIRARPARPATVP